jgi:hypothetical protein
MHANPTRPVVTLPGTGQSRSVKSADVSSDFTRTTVSFLAPAITTNSPLGALKASRTLDAYVADVSSSCGCSLACVGNFTLRYAHSNLASFVTMSPTSGAPSIVNFVVLVVNNVKTFNVSSGGATITVTSYAFSLLSGSSSYSISSSLGSSIETAFVLQINTQIETGTMYVMVTTSLNSVSGTFNIIFLAA